MADAPRAKPLNALTLAALPVGVQAWQDEIDYLAAAIEQTANANLRERFKTKHAALVRARDWLASKIAAEGAADA